MEGQGAAEGAGAGLAENGGVYSPLLTCNATHELSTRPALQDESSAHDVHPFPPRRTRGHQVRAGGAEVVGGHQVQRTARLGHRQVELPHVPLQLLLELGALLGRGAAGERWIREHRLIGMSD